MNTVIHALAMYLFLMLILRISGRRTLGEMTTFDFVLVMVIGEATQQALLLEDRSLTNSWIVIVTLVGLDIALSLLKQKFPKVGTLMEGSPTILVHNGAMFEKLMNRARVDRADIMHAARKTRGLERLDQIKYAIIEADGHISIIPRDPGDMHHAEQPHAL